MRKSLKKQQLSDSDIPVASFSDLAFLLIIFFILTTTLQKATGFLTDIPSSIKNQAQQQQEKTTTIALHKDQIVLNDENISMAELRQRLMDMNLRSQIGDTRVVLLTATGKVKYQTYYETMSTITDAGGLIAIIREEEEKKR